MPMGIQKTFEENMEEMSRMSPEQVQARIKGFEKICICVECPTYIGTGEKKLVFCTLGKSTIITRIKVACAALRPMTSIVPWSL